MNNVLHSDATHLLPRRTDRLTIGFLNSNVDHEWALWPWQGALDAASAHQVNLVSLVGHLVAQKQDFGGQANVLYALVNTRRLDGLIIWNAGLVTLLSERESEAFCRRFGLPVVTIEGELPGMSCVTYSNYEGMQRIVTHLIEAHGYRRIGFVGMYQHHAGFQDRYRAYGDTLRTHGLSEDPELTQWWFPDEAIRDARIEESLFRAYLRRALAAGVEALVGVADTIASQLLLSLRALNVSVPHDVAVVGFDGFTQGRVTIPPLTTVDPGWYDLGYQAMTTIVRTLAGEPVPQRFTVPAQVIIRQSCGCADTAITHVAPRLTAPASATADPTRGDVAPLAHDMFQAMAGEGLDRMDGAAGESLIRAFQNELSGESTGRFLLELESLIRASAEADKDVSAWHDALSVLREQTVYAFTDPDAAARAENLWHQARVLIGKSAAREELSRRLHAEQLAGQLREIGQVLITTFNVSDIMDVLASNLPFIGIPRCYLAMFEQPQTYEYPAPAPEWARLRLAYDERERLALPPDGWRFPSWQFTPPEILPPGASIHLIAEALYFKEDQIGFVLFEPGPRDGYIYEALRGQISSALQGALLMQSVQERSAEIVRQKYILDTFMANVPDSIYFKDRDSRFTQVNQALAQRFDVGDPASIVGKSDFDFFVADQANSKYEQEQVILRTGQALLDLEEPDAGGLWALTTKMPLRDEHGAIIGTFGISRDITALKRAQLEVAAAYEEIKVLNTRLQAENLRMSAELDVSRRIQQMVLPTPAELVQIDGLDIAGYMQSAEEVGGDYYDVLQKNDIVHIGIGDVTGHGLESGVLMLMTQTAIRTLIEHGETDSKSFLTTLNRVILKNARRMNVDKTLTFALVKYGGGEVKIVGQHEELLVVRRGGHIEQVNTFHLGFPLGLEEDIASFLAEATVTLHDGESLVLYTDGITEAENVGQQFYGLERLCEALSQQWDKSAEQIKQAVVEDVLRFVGPQKVYDDITLVVLKQ